jgi:hypothetical protein
MRREKSSIGFTPYLNQTTNSKLFMMWREQVSTLTLTNDSIAGPAVVSRID